ncbi:hypothetical protein HDE_00332 [Halotydeus destructor]|nr:hypothetical protein HDE_00332 [Halotydeus destructor]
MMSAIVILLLVGGAILEVSTKAFNFQDCGDPATRYATIDRLQVSPDPLQFGQEVYANGTFTILRTIPEGSFLFLELWRTVEFFGGYKMDMPFVPCTANGICRVELARLIKHWRMGCDFIKRATRQSDHCEVPLVPGRYAADNVMSFIPELMYTEHRIGPGAYKARVRLYDVNNNELACAFIMEEVYQ